MGMLSTSCNCPASIWNILITLVFISISLKQSCLSMPIEAEIVQHNPIDIEEFQNVKLLLANLTQLAQKEHYGGVVNNSITDSNSEDQTTQRRGSQMLTKINTASATSSSQNSAINSIFAFPSVSQYLFEGDIVLTPKQARKLVEDISADPRGKRRKPPNLKPDSKSQLPPNLFPHYNLYARQKRKIIRDPFARWTNFPIPYTFENNVVTDDLRAKTIHESVMFWQEQTCISFRFSSSEPKNADFMRFFKGQGCYSMIGRVGGGGQGVSIGRGCNKIGVIAHEIAHALGLWHEQSRPEFNKYIRILPRNIIPAFISNFLSRDPSEVLSLGIPYDVGSVMHYGPQAFTSDWTKNTIETILPGYQRTIGQRELPAFYDVKMINLAYCPGRCNSFTSANCINGGYNHPRDCSKCICPRGLGGRLCNQVQPSKGGDCGGIFTARQNWQYVQSIGYLKEGYVPGIECNWLLQAPVGERVELEFLSPFQFFCTQTCLDYVEVKNSSDFGLTGMRFCCFTPPTFSIVSEKSSMLLLFRAFVSSDVGFRAKFKIYQSETIKSGHSAIPNLLTTSTSKSDKKPASPWTYVSGLITGRPDFVLGNGGWKRMPMTPKLPTLITGLPVPSLKAKRPKQTVSEYDVSEPRFSGDWTGWSDCSRKCGACGYQSRTRSCENWPFCMLEFTHNMKDVQLRPCGFAACTVATPPCDSEIVACSNGLCRAADTINNPTANTSDSCNVHRCCEPYELSNSNICQTGPSFRNGKKTHGGEWSDWGRWWNTECQSNANVGIANETSKRTRKRWRVCLDDECRGSDFDSQRCK